MKKFFLPAVILFAVTLFNACSKSASNTIQGKWNVVSDSTITSGATISYSIYNGTRGDYFVFANNILYTKEGSVYDTIGCNQKSDSTITFDKKTAINANSIPQTGTYTLSGSTLRIVVTPDFINPGFYLGRIINLKR